MPSAHLPVHPAHLLLLGLALMSVSGCTAGPLPRGAHASAPSIGDDTPLHSRGGTNPNAPFALLGQPPRLTTRPGAVEVEAASACTAKELSAFESGSQLNGDRRAVRLSLVNHGSFACRLGGYPAISLLRKDGTLIGNITVEKITSNTLTAELASPDTAAVASTPSPQVLLSASGGEASFNIGWTSASGCDEVGQIAVSAPGTTTSFIISHLINVCAGRIQVTAIGNDSHL